MEIQQLTDWVENRFQFLRQMGLTVQSLQPGKVRLKLPIQGNQNHMGSMWAGALFTLAEVPGGILAYTVFDTSRFYPLVREMRIKFLKPATTDVTIDMTLDPDTAARLKQEAEETGKANFSLIGELIDGDDQVVATTVGDYQLRRYDI